MNSTSDVYIKPGYMYSETYNKLQQITGILFMIFGICGNTISICIFWGKKFNKQTIGMYLLFVSLFDMACLIVGFIRNELGFKSQKLLICQLTTFAYYILLEISSWLLVLTSFDLMVSIVWLNVIQIRKKRWFQLTLILVILCVLALVNIRVVLDPLNVGIMLMDGRNCRPKNEHLMATNTQTTLLFSIIPFFLMLTNTCFILFKVIKSRQKSQIKTNNTDTIRDSIRIAILVNVSFFVLNVPVGIVIGIFNYLELRKGYYGEALIYVKFSIYLLVSVHKSCSMFIYIATNRVYRNEFSRLISSYYNHQHHHASNRVANVANT